MMHQMDVKYVFLNGPIEEEAQIGQPPGFEIEGHWERVYKLRKAHYGLKKDPKAWNRRIDGYLCTIGFQRCTSEHEAYMKNDTNVDVLIVCPQVNDLLVARSKDASISNFMFQMMQELEMINLGEFSYFQGIEFKRIKEGDSNASAQVCYLYTKEV